MNIFSRDLCSVHSLVEEKTRLSVSIDEMVHDPSSYRLALLARLDVVDADDFAKARALNDHIFRIVEDDDTRDILFSEISRSLPCFDGRDLSSHYRLVVSRLFDVVLRIELASMSKEMQFMDARISAAERIEIRQREERVRMEERQAKKAAKKKEASLESIRNREIKKAKALELRRVVECDPLEVSKSILSLHQIDFSNYDFFVGSVRGRRGTHVAFECRDEDGIHYFVYPRDKQFRVVSKSQIDYYKRYRCQGRVSV